MLIENESNFLQVASLTSQLGFDAFYMFVAPVVDVSWHLWPCLVISVFRVLRLLDGSSVNVGVLLVLLIFVAPEISIVFGTL